jgi:hypothetical protein
LELCDLAYGLQIGQLEARWVAFSAAHPPDAESDGSVRVFKEADGRREQFDAWLVSAPARLSRSDVLKRRLGVS